jgi:hypothetical protein
MSGRRTVETIKSELAVIAPEVGRLMTEGESAVGLPRADHGIVEPGDRIAEDYGQADAGGVGGAARRGAFVRLRNGR